MSTLTDFFDVVVDKGGEFSDRWLDREFGKDASPPPSKTVKTTPTPDEPIYKSGLYVPGSPVTDNIIVGGVPINKKILYGTGGVLVLIVLVKLFT